MTGEPLRRWRLVLGTDAPDPDGQGIPLNADDLAMDRALAWLYEAEETRSPETGRRRGGLGGSAPGVARWLGDIRQYFPSSVVQVMQRDAMTRLGLQQLLLEPEMLRAVEPDIHLVGTLLALKGVIPEKTKATARLVVRRVVEDLERRLASPLRQAITGSLQRSVRNRRPRYAEIDWHRTIRANLKHYQPEQRTVIPERLLGFGRRTRAQRDIILCLDQSGSMAGSVVYSSVMGAVMASIRSVRTALVVFDTSVVDLTPHLQDPVDVLFGVRLGGGTDITRAVSYCQGLITRPSETIFILISDLIEGGNPQQLYRRMASVIASGVRCITLLALDDAGAPCYDHHHAGVFTALGSPCFACTPDLFPEMMATVLQRQDISQWAASRGIQIERAEANQLPRP
jgi:Mg-chelatase subunit ChlD